MDRPISSRKRRIAALLIDAWFFAYLTSLSMYLVFFVFKTPLDNPLLHNLGVHFFLWLFGVSLFAAKDSFTGLGLGKLIMGIRVFERTQGKPATAWRTFTRNISLLGWPIEAVVMVMNSNKRRLGDYLVNTQVLQDPKIKPSQRMGAALLVVVFYWVTPSLPKMDFSEAGFMQLSQFALKQSDAFDVAKQQVLAQEGIVLLIGPIQTIEVGESSRVSINNDQGKADFVLNVQGENGHLPVKVSLNRVHDEWQLRSLSYEQTEQLPVP